MNVGDDGDLHNFFRLIFAEFQKEKRGDAEDDSGDFIDGYIFFKEKISHERHCYYVENSHNERSDNDIFIFVALSQKIHANEIQEKSGGVVDGKRGGDPFFKDDISGSENQSAGNGEDEG
jgi:hypothetical protein